MALMRVNKSFEIYISKEQLEEYLLSSGIEEGMILPHQNIDIEGIEIDPSSLRLTIDASVFQREDA